MSGEDDDADWGVILALALGLLCPMLSAAIFLFVTVAMDDWDE